MRRFKGECTHFRFNKCPIYVQPAQVPNLAPTHTKRVTVYLRDRTLESIPGLIKRLKIQTLYAHCRMPKCTKVQVKGSASLDSRFLLECEFYTDTQNPLYLIQDPPTSRLYHSIHV